MVGMMMLLLFYRVMLDRLHDQDLFLLIVYTIYVLQFRILVDKYNLFYCDKMLDFLYFDDFVHVLFLSMYEIHEQVFVNEQVLLHDRQVNEHHAMDNHFDLMDAMVHVAMMML